MEKVTVMLAVCVMFLAVAALLFRPKSATSVADAYLTAPVRT
jgi:hypothetical protein